jgi:uncharacterized protein YjbI with pentapeptide repeats
MKLSVRLFLALVMKLKEANMKRFALLVQIMLLVGMVSLSFSPPKAYALSPNCAALPTPGVDLSGCTFTGSTVFIGVNLTGANLMGATFTNSSFAGTTLSNAKLNGATFTGVNFTGAILSGAKLNSATFTTVDFTGATLIGTNFSSATMTTADFTGATLTNSNFFGATFTTPNFTNTDLTGVRGTNVILTGAIWATTTCPDGTISSVICVIPAGGAPAFTSTPIIGSQQGCPLYLVYHIWMCDLHNLDLSHRNFSDTQWDLNGVDLHDTDLRVGHFNNVDFSYSNLINTKFTYSTLNGAHFANANLTNANLQYTSLLGVSSGGITGTNIYYLLIGN